MMITNPEIGKTYYAPGLDMNCNRTVERVVLFQLGGDLPNDYDCVVTGDGIKLMWTTKNLFATYGECLHAKI